MSSLAKLKFVSKNTGIQPDNSNNYVKQIKPVLKRIPYCIYKIGNRQYSASRLHWPAKEHTVRLVPLVRQDIWQFYKSLVSLDLHRDTRSDRANLNSITVLFTSFVYIVPLVPGIGCTSSHRAFSAVSQSWVPSPHSFIFSQFGPDF